MPHKLMRDPLLRINAKVLYSTMWVMIDDASDTCTASIRQIAAMMNASPTTVQHGINRLEETGWIGVVRGGNGVRSRYTLYMDPSDGEAADE